MINYYNNDASRRVTLSACDLGDGIFVHGRGALKPVGLERSTENRIDRITISRSFWDGELNSVSIFISGSNMNHAAGYAALIALEILDVVKRISNALIEAAAG